MEQRLEAKKHTLMRDREQQLSELESKVKDMEGLEDKEGLVAAIKKTQKQHKEATQAVREAKIQLELEEQRNKELLKSINQAKLEIS